MSTLMELMVKIGGDTSGLDKALGSVGGKVASMGKSIVGGMAKFSVAAVGAAAAGVTALTKTAVDAYANYQQLEGGVQTLYGSAMNKVMTDAKAAYETAGLSMNEYMDTVNGMAGALKQSLGSESAAADKANQAVIQMADNANKMGTSLESIQNAYAGFAKGNYTMLDNLKLGYGGTKEEMQRLLDKAKELKAKQGEMVDYSIDSYADIVDAIKVVQDEMGITGTTADEARETITGSLAMVKSSWENLMTTLASGDSSAISDSISKLVDSAKTALTNLKPVIIDSIKGIAQLITELAPVIAEELPALMREILPPLTEALVQLLEAALPVLAELLPGMIQTLLPALIESFSALVHALVEAWPEIWAGLKEAFGIVVDEISKALEEKFPGIGEMLSEVLQNLEKWAPVLITLAGAWATLKAAMAISNTISSVTAGFNSMKGALTLVGGKLKLFGTWMTGTAIPAITSFITAAAPFLGILAAIAAAIAVVVLVVKNWGAISEWLGDVWGGIKMMAEDVWNGICDVVTFAIEEIGEFLEEVWNGIADFLGGIWDGIKNTASEVWGAITGLASEIWGGITDTISGLVEGVADTLSNTWDGIKQTASDAWNAVNEAASELWDGICNTVTDLVDGLITWLGDTWDSIKSTASTAWENLKTTASEKWDAICNTAKDLVDGMKEAIGKKWEEIKTAASEAWDNLKQALADKWQAFWDTAADIGRAIKEGFHDVVKSAADWGYDLCKNLYDGLIRGKTLVSTGAVSVADSIKGPLHHSHPDYGPLADDYTYMPDMIDLFVAGIENNIRKVENASDDLAYALKPDITDVTGEVEINKTVKEANGDTAGEWSGDIIIPMYLDGSMIDERVIKAQQIHDYRSGGR